MTTIYLLSHVILWFMWAQLGDPSISRGVGRRHSHWVVWAVRCEVHSHIWQVEMLVTQASRLSFTWPFRVTWDSPSMATGF